MKHLRLVLSLSLVAFVATLTIASADTYDSNGSLVITKASDKTAKVMIGTKMATTPITFADGAGWDNVKDSYSVDPSTFSALQAGTMTIIIADGKHSYDFAYTLP